MGSFDVIFRKFGHNMTQVLNRNFNHQVRGVAQRNQVKMKMLFPEDQGEKERVELLQVGWV